MPDQVIKVTNGSSLVVRTGAILGVGPQGPIGPSGPKGDIGIQGSILYFTPAPPVQTGQLRTGDSWCDPNSGVISVYNAGTGNWTAGTTSIKGMQGIQGNQGIQGIVGPAGPQGSASGGFPTFNSLLQPGDQHPGYP
jgi:hypothetical protein